MLDIYSLLKIPADTVAQVKTQRPLLGDNLDKHNALCSQMFLSLADHLEFIEKLDSASLFDIKCFLSLFLSSWSSFYPLLTLSPKG